MTLINKNCRFIFFMTMMMISLVITAQSNEVQHLVKAGETLSGLAKQFHTTVGEIMRLNGMNNKSILRTGKKIKIPSIKIARVAPNKIEKKVVIVKTETQPTSDVDAKIHWVEKSETLYSISKKYNVTVDQIKLWNNLPDNNIHANQRLVIEISTNKQPVTATTISVNKITETQSPSIIQPQLLSQQNQQTNVSGPQKDTLIQKNIIEKNKPINPVVKQPLPIVTKEEIEELEPVINVKDIGKEGYFASQFQRGKNELTGVAATFKTASGWLDKKYYILINSIEVGTIVRITVNNKSVFAKILGPLPDVKNDNGLLLRICNAAASVLDVADSKFSVILNY